jgi:hypothetical protein
MRAVFERINPTANAGKIVSALMVATAGDRASPSPGRADRGHRPRQHRDSSSKDINSADSNSKDRALEGGREVWTVYADNEGHGFNKGTTPTTSARRSALPAAVSAGRVADQRRSGSGER